MPVTCMRVTAEWGACLVRTNSWPGLWGHAEFKDVQVAPEILVLTIYYKARDNQYRLNKWRILLNLHLVL